MSTPHPRTSRPALWLVLATGALALAAVATPAQAQDAGAGGDDPLVSRACDAMVALAEADAPGKRGDHSGCVRMMSQVRVDCSNATEVLECVAAVTAPDALMRCAEKCEETEAGRKANGGAAAEHGPDDGHGHGAPAFDPDGAEARACTHAVEVMRKEGLAGDSPDDLGACVADLARMREYCAAVHGEMLGCIEQASGSEAVFACIERCDDAAGTAPAAGLPADIQPATAEQACEHLAKLSRDEGQVVVDEDLPKCRISVEKIAADCSNPERVYGCFVAIESTAAFMDCAVVCEPKQPAP